MTVTLEEKVAAALAPLHGLPVWHTSRAHTLIALQVGTYALHLQCKWRLTALTGVVTGTSDIYRPADDTVTIEEIDDCAKGRMLVDVALHGWRATYAARPLCVRGVRTDRFGGFALELDEGHVLEVFIDASAAAHDAGELWRLFVPGRTDLRHFVVLESGIESDA